jgi:uncharacterized membrane protein YgcG
MSAPLSSERDQERTRALRRARRITWLVLIGGLALLLAGGAEILTADAGPLVLAGGVALLTGIAICVLAERRLSRIAYVLKPPRLRRTWSSGGAQTRDSDVVHWAAVGWFGGHGEGSGGGGGGFWDSFGGGGGDGGGGGGG